MNDFHMMMQRIKEEQTVFCCGKGIDLFDYNVLECSWNAIISTKDDKELREALKIVSKESVFDNRNVPMYWDNEKIYVLCLNDIINEINDKNYEQDVVIDVCEKFISHMSDSGIIVIENGDDNFFSQGQMKNIIDNDAGREIYIFNCRNMASLGENVVSFPNSINMYLKSYYFREDYIVKEDMNPNLSSKRTNVIDKVITSKNREDFVASDKADKIISMYPKITIIMAVLVLILLCLLAIIFVDGKKNSKIGLVESDIILSRKDDEFEGYYKLALEGSAGGF